jgi:hypothetical protein
MPVCALPTRLRDSIARLWCSSRCSSVCWLLMSETGSGLHDAERTQKTVRQLPGPVAVLGEAAASTQGPPRHRVAADVAGPRTSMLMSSM